MATSPECPSESRAPPPSPVADKRRTEAFGDDELSTFLECSLTVPDLILPNRFFPRQILGGDPPEIDFRTLFSSDNSGCSPEETLKSAAERIGCFQLVNHMIPREVIRSAGNAAMGVFRIPDEKKMAVKRSPERKYGFEKLEEEGEEESRGGEELFWLHKVCAGEQKSVLQAEMAGIWPQGYKDFRYQMERLWTEVDNIAIRIGQILQPQTPLSKGSASETETTAAARGTGEEAAGSVLCLHKHKHAGSDSAGDSTNSLPHDAVRVLIRGSGHTHSLCIHICPDSSMVYHVYSKRGLYTFTPNSETLVVTIGDQMQECNGGGGYKTVIGKPVLYGQGEEAISIAFLYSHPPISKTSCYADEEEDDDEKTISLAHQVKIAAYLVLLYHIIVFLF